MSCLVASSMFVIIVIAIFLFVFTTQNTSVHVGKFNFTKYPHHFINLHNYAWESVINFVSHAHGFQTIFFTFIFSL